MTRKTRKITDRRKHLRRTPSGNITDVRKHPMHYWGVQYKSKDASGKWVTLKHTISPSKYLANKHLKSEKEVFSEIKATGRFPKEESDILGFRVKKLKDSDGDGTPDAVDCQPFNPDKQDEVTSKNLVNYIMEYEGGNMTVKQYLNMFSYLIKTGQAWQLQGSIYGRPAKALIDSGQISPKGKVNWKKVEESGVDPEAMIYSE